MGKGFFKNLTKTVTGHGKFLEKGLGDVGRFMGIMPEKVNPYEVGRGYFEPGKEEQGLVQQLIARSQGKMPSLAEVLLQRGIDQANAQSLALAASQRGVDPALAARMAAQAQASNIQQGAQTAAGLRAEEQAEAESRLAQALQSIRSGRMAGEQLQAGAVTSAREAQARAAEGAAGRRFNFLGNIGKGIASGMSGGAGAGGAGGASMAEGGEVPHYAVGGFISRPDAPAQIQPEQSKMDASKIPSMILGSPGGARLGRIPNIRIPTPAPTQEPPPMSASELKKQQSLNMSAQLPTGVDPEMYQAIQNAPVATPAPAYPSFQRPRMGYGFNPFGSRGGGFGFPRFFADGGKVDDKMIVNPDLINLQPMSATGFMTPIQSNEIPYESETAQKLAMLKYHGGDIPGRAKHDGDHLENDTVPAMLSPGEIVLPRSIAQAEDAPELAKEFVEQIKKQKKSKEAPSYSRILAMNHMMEQPSDEKYHLMAALQNRAKGLA